MKTTQPDLAGISKMDSELQSLVHLCGKAELAQCVRLLSMYVALYKKSFGELPPASFSKILTTDQVDADMAGIFEIGMREAVGILTMVLKAQVEQQRHSGVTINQLEQQRHSGVTIN